MKARCNIGGFWVAAVVYLLSVAAMFSSTSSPAALTGEEIAKRIIARAQASSAAQSKHQQYTYKKLSINEELDDQGRVKERKEKVLFFKEGSGSLLAMKVNGKALNATEFRKQEEKAAQEQVRIGDKPARRDENWEKYLTPDLLSKYQFKLLSRTNYNGRPTYVLAFQPISQNLPVKQMADRLINQVAGKVWVDEQEYEIARAEINLLSEVNLWGGMLGSLKKFYYLVDRTRLDENIWFNRATYGDFQGRKLLDNTHMKLRSESSNFQRILPMSSR
ncbi:MAG: hypothetical protein JWM16_4270 [Verrucomicrobiales bacterium]|nr:hypothetical protein [Verrucomicrobiales bacterium]